MVLPSAVTICLCTSIHKIQFNHLLGYGHFRTVSETISCLPIDLCKCLTPLKERVDKLVANGIIQGFGVLVNPVIFGYEKECVLRVKNIDKTIKEQDLFKKISLLGDIFIFVRQPEGAATFFVLFVRTGAEGKIGVSDSGSECTYHGCFMAA